MPKITKQADNISIATNANTMFNPSKNEEKDPHCTQNINVTIKIDQQEDGITSAIKAIANIFKKGRK